MTENEREIIAAQHETLKQYRAIGTVEDIKSMKENGAFTGVELAQLAAMQMKLKGYQSIGTIEEFKALKEKGIPIIHGKAELELHDKEIRNNVINEFLDKAYEKLGADDREIYCEETIREIAEEMRGAE